ncbi:MAG: tetratricopeptide repeat protein [Acidobacteria bacterium]|nr:tetratricopeptide repeat protein [Acidobacteriota bacterium]
MIRKSLSVLIVCFAAAFAAFGQSNQNDTVLVLPFENASGKAEFGWVGESFASSLSELLKVPSLNVVSNDERKIIQQRLRVPLTILPSLATALKLARESKATILIAGRYTISPAQGETVASISVTAKIIRVNEGRFLSEEFPDGRKITRDIDLSDALLNLQTMQGQMAYRILYQRDKALPFRLNDFIEQANKVPARAFEAYIKGLLTPDSDAISREGYLKNALRIYAEDEKTKGGIYADAALELGHHYLASQKFAESIDAFARIPAEAPQYAESAFYTGLIHWQQQNYEQALAVLRPLAEDLKLTSVYNTIGAIAVQASRADKKNKAKASALLAEGIDHLKKALDSAPDAADVRFNYGFALFLNNQYAESALQLRPVLAISPKDGESYFLLAKATEILKEANSADFDNMARQFLVAGDRYAKLQVEWGRAKTVDTIVMRITQPPRKDFVSVILIKRQATPTPTPVNETEALLNLARKHYRDGRDDEAIEVLRRVLVSEPMSAESYYLLGMIHIRRTDFDQAVSSLKTALFWDNRLTNAYIALVKIYVDRKDCLQAQNYLRSVQEIDGENQEVQGLQRMVERCSAK